MALEKHITNTDTPPAEKLVGIGLRAPHYKDILNPDHKNDIGWIEVHPENHFGGGAPRQALSNARAHYPLSFHGVGLSLGSDQSPCKKHLQSLKELTTEYAPFQVSDHVSWSQSGNAHLGDLLPLPYNKETLQRLCDNINKTQDYLGQQILMENPSSYIALTASTMPEHDFMNAIADKTGCAVLLDINNIYVQACNHNFDAATYIKAITPSAVKEIHLAGHIEKPTETRPILIDTHSRPVTDTVWDLYTLAIQTFGAVPTLIEWDQDIPTIDILIKEARTAHAIMNNYKKSQSQ